MLLQVELFRQDDRKIAIENRTLFREQDGMSFGADHQLLTDVSAFGDCFDFLRLFVVASD